VKKLISIGVALALLAMVVLPIGVAAQDCDYEGIQPTTYAKIPFAIIESGFVMVGGLLETLGPTLGLPEWLNAELVASIGSWAGGPLSWTVDMMAWGLSLLGAVLGVVTPLLGLPEDLDLVGLVNTIACALFQPFACNVTGAVFTPCA